MPIRSLALVPILLSVGACVGVAPPAEQRQGGALSREEPPPTQKALQPNTGIQNPSTGNPTQEPRIAQSERAQPRDQESKSRRRKIEDVYTTPTGWALQDGAGFSKQGTVADLFPGGLSTQLGLLTADSSARVRGVISAAGKLTIETPVQGRIGDCIFEIEAGAELASSGNGATIMEAEAVMSSAQPKEICRNVHLPKSETDADRSVQVETRGVFLREKDGSFLMKSGRVSVRRGILRVVGEGAIYEPGSRTGRR